LENQQVCRRVKTRAVRHLARRQQAETKGPPPAAPLFAQGASSGNSGKIACNSATSTTSTYVTAPSVLTPVAESPAAWGGDENEAPASVAKPAARWRRKTAAERADADRRQHMAEMRAHFQEVLEWLAAAFICTSALCLLAPALRMAAAAHATHSHAAGRRL
jgi:hypothetical protein